MNGGSWTQKAEAHSQKNKSSPKNVSTLDVESGGVQARKPEEFLVKHIIVQSPQSQESAKDFQCIGCKGSATPQDPHVIYWDIGVSVPLICSGSPIAEKYFGDLHHY